MVVAGLILGRLVSLETSMFIAVFKFPEHGLSHLLVTAYLKD